MKAWEHIIHAAMLGTDKPLPGNIDLPEELMGIEAAIDAADSLDKEGKFLKKAAILYNYRQCGFIPLQKRDLDFVAAIPETKPYCSTTATRLLGSILEEDSIPLLELWLTRCRDSNQLIPPDMLPVVLDKAIKADTLQPLVITCSGNRGQWLSGLNAEWNYFVNSPDEEIWQTGKLQDRIKVLRKVRLQDPAKALEWVQQAWPQENAAGKAELLNTIWLNLSAADLPWLETLLSEKSQKVKDQVLRLLKLLPGSSIVSLYEEVLSQSVTLKKGKALLGLVNKTTLQFKLPDSVNESIFRTGIEKMAGPNMPFSDEGYILYQLIGAVPPGFWERHLGEEPVQIMEYFEKYAADKLPALGTAVVQFKSAEWAPLVMQQNKFHPELVSLLSPGNQDGYLLRFIGRDAHQVISAAFELGHEWGLRFTAEALRYMVNNPYHYGRAFYNNHIHLIPVAIQNQLNSFEAKEPYMQSMWEKNRNHLQKLLSLKQQIQQVFNA